MKYNELCVVFINSDEPNADENYEHLLKVCPHNNIIRVTDAKSFEEAAIFTCERSTTEHFILVDGDNKIDPRIWAEHNTISSNLNNIISFSALNYVNGLCYGNGSIKLWKKSLLNQVLEKAEGKIDLYHCGLFLNRNECYSTTYINGSPYQAFRAAFREVVKLTLENDEHSGKIKIEDFETYNKKVNDKFRKRTKIWCSVGRDVQYGDWAILGARMAAWHNMSEDTIDINSFEEFDYFWKTIVNKDVEVMNMEYFNKITKYFSIMDYTPEQSSFFKSVYVNPPKFDYMSEQTVKLLYPDHIFS